MKKSERKPQKDQTLHEAGLRVADWEAKATTQSEIFKSAKDEKTIDEHGKAAHRIAKKLATGGLAKMQKAKMVSNWATHMKAIIQTDK